ncbi:tyrosine-protein kinase receptor [Plakobranchus ocellatus]|uniref:Tyrosine-protein kinase receptor n=1 Tax=Plakobranchus ocellatus TaxID=259542 RepID=A0AAV3YHM9_9GAST|nr:tyrosine-protein kinase receptor [Plakobranchus ocellatus]
MLAKRRREKSASSCSSSEQIQTKTLYRIFRGSKGDARGKQIRFSTNVIQILYQYLLMSQCMAQSNRSVVLKQSAVVYDFSLIIKTS